MTQFKNPSEIARETLKQLAGRRMPPTPVNYKTLYQEISGVQNLEDDFPEKHLRSLTTALPMATPDQQRLARELESAVKANSWDSYRTRLIEFISTIGSAQKLAWGELINELLKQWETKHSGITPARKRESLDRILGNAGVGPEVLYTRLQNIVRSWAQGKEADMALEGDIPAEETASNPEVVTDAHPAKAPTPSRDSELLHELRELFAYTLETAISTQLAFDLTNPNKVYSLIRNFGANLARFHTADGYAFLAQQTCRLDAKNPQVASRLARCFDRWKKFDATHQVEARKALESIRDHAGLSRDVLEVVTRSLG